MSEEMRNKGRVQLIKRSSHPMSVTQEENKSNDVKGRSLRYLKPSSPISLLSKLRTSKLDIDAMCLKPRFEIHDHSKWKDSQKYIMIV